MPFVVLGLLAYLRLDSVRFFLAWGVCLFRTGALWTDGLVATSWGAVPTIVSGPWTAVRACPPLANKPKRRIIAIGLVKILAEFSGEKIDWMNVLFAMPCSPPAMA